MKHTTFYKIALFLLAVSFLAGCGSNGAETEPARDTLTAAETTLPAQATEGETETAPPEETQTDSPATEPVAEIDFAPKDCYDHPEKYEMYLFADLEYGCDAIVTPDREVYDFQFFLLDSQSLFEQEEFKIAEILHTCESLSPEKPFVTRIYIVGAGGPYYGVSFLDEAGNLYRYVIFESGEDGRFSLVSF